MNARVQDLRLAFIWTRFLGHLFDDPVPDVPFAFLGRDTTWAPRFEAVRRYHGDPDHLTPPWPRHRGKHFWGMYLGCDPWDVDPWRAWKHFVPLRLKRPVEVEAPWLEGRVDTEGFFYPHGYALVVDVRLRPADPDGWPLFEAVDHAHEVRSGRAFDVTVGGVTRSMRLDSLAAAALDRLGRIAHGDRDSGRASRPYSVSTFVRVDGVDSSLPVQQDDDVHRALDALTHWNGAWRYANLSPLDQAAAPDPLLPPSHVHYVRPGGQAAWFPGLADPRLKHRKLSCYHRNQTLAALQIESVGGLAVRTADRDRAGQAIPFAQDQCANQAAGLLGRLYGWTRDTYSSRASQAHLQAAGLVRHVDHLRARYALPALHA